jgi:hypothetical protein
MIASHQQSCDCMECRVRHALRADDAPTSDDGMITVEISQALRVLCKVSAELLAHRSARDTKGFFFRLLAYREAWKKEAHVMMQREPQGQA